MRSKMASGQPIGIVIPPIGLEGTFVRPDHAYGLVIFAHGSGSSRHSPRNHFVAKALNAAGLATLLIDLLTQQEASLRRNAFDVDLLAHRVGHAIAWVQDQPECERLPIGIFGASTGAAAALTAASRQPHLIKAVVSRGGRPDLAGSEVLGRVTAPTLLIVGGADEEVLRLNENARTQMSSPTQLVVIPGATHLFEEPGTLAEVARTAAGWFLRWIAPGHAHPAIPATPRPSRK